MPVNKKQLQRLVKFVAMLKENRYPNCASFVAELRKEDLYGNRNILCTEKTIQRDINTLKKDFNAPIEYDTERKGYRLMHHGWDFPCPLFEEHELIASILGAKVAEDIFPPPLKNSIRRAVDFQLTTNNPDFLDTAYINSLVISSGLKVIIDPDVFNCIFESWKTHTAADIVYKDVEDRLSSRRIDPHVLAFQDSAWFIRAFCHKQNSVRTFAVHRIVSAKLTDRSFEPDENLIRNVKREGPFVYRPIKNARIVCDMSIRKYLIEKPLHGKQVIKDIGEGNFSLFIPEIWDADLIHWILYQGGKAKLASPKSFVKKIAEAAQKILKLHL